MIYVQSSHSVVVFELVKRDLLFSKSSRQALAGRAVYQQYRYITKAIRLGILITIRLPYLLNY